MDQTRLSSAWFVRLDRGSWSRAAALLVALAGMGCSQTRRSPADMQITASPTDMTGDGMSGPTAPSFYFDGIDIPVGPMAAPAPVVSDFNNDGLFDVVSWDLIFLNNGKGGLQPAVETGASGTIAADFNGDHNMDLASGVCAGGSLSVHLGDGTGRFGPSIDTIVHGRSRIYCLGRLVSSDWNGDGLVDLATPDSLAPWVGMLLGKGDGTFANARSFSSVPYSESAVAGDWNRDNKQDLAVYYGVIDVHLGNGMGDLGAPSSYDVGGGISRVVSGDFNHDGNLDLAASNKYANSVSVFFGDGTGSFGTPLLLAAGAHPRSLVIGDFNGDNNLDLVVANLVDGTVSVMFGDGRGKFSRQDHPSLCLMEMAAGDIDNDGLPDLVGTCGGHLSVMFSRTH